MDCHLIPCGDRLTRTGGLNSASTARCRHACGGSTRAHRLWERPVLPLIFIILPRGLLGANRTVGGDVVMVVVVGAQKRAPTTPAHLALRPRGLTSGVTFFDQLMVHAHPNSLGHIAQRSQTAF